MRWVRPIRLAGLGSHQDADGLGWRVVARLQERLGSNADVAANALAGPAGLLDMLDGTGTLVIVDAVQSGAPVGTLHRWRWPGPEFVQWGGTSTHGLGLMEVLPLAATLGLLPPVVEVWGVEVAAEPVPKAVAAAAEVALVEELLATSTQEMHDVQDHSRSR
ncbi:MAG TPA: hydrogenase maturation protease [Gemmatales bacterium]|nr:hydrogenase maturation protease [Gemmatales bacterium]HMP58910.1 hydrogenase maturation protease [Gemmatales bacterium]